MSERKEEQVFVFIEGKVVDLVAPNSKWADLTCKWMNDPKVRRYARNPWPRNLEEIKKWFDPPTNDRTRDFVVFTIYHKEDNKPIIEPNDLIEKHKSLSIDDNHPMKDTVKTI